MTKEQLVDVCLMAGYAIQFLPDGAYTEIAIFDERREKVTSVRIISDTYGEIQKLAATLFSNLKSRARPLNAAISLYREVCPTETPDPPQEIV